MPCDEQLGKGDLANRIVTVGAESRAAKIAANFDQDKEVKKFQSSRGFTTFTGYFDGVHVSVVAIGMVSSVLVSLDLARRVGN